MNQISKLLFTAVIITTISACSPKVSFTQTGAGPSLLERESGCSFRLYTSKPTTQYIELGVIEFRQNGLGPIGPKSINSAKKMMQPFVCKAGGNGALLWEINGSGQYIQATVIKTL